MLDDRYLGYHRLYEVAVSYDSKATLSDGWSEGVCVYREYRYSIGDSEWTWNNRCGCQEGK